MALAVRALRATCAAATAARAVAPRAWKSTAAVDADHKAWLEKVKSFKEETEPHMEFTLEWLMPSPVPMHMFDQPPIVVEVKNRNPEFEEMH